MGLILRTLTIDKLLIRLLLISGGLAIISDLKYGSKENAEQYMFGLFLTHLSTFILTISTIIILICLIIYIIKRLNPLILSKLQFEEEKPKTRCKSKHIKNGK